MDGNQTQMLTLRIPSALARRLAAKAPAGERSAFVARAIEQAVAGATDYEAGYRAGNRRGFESMLERAMIDRNCYWDALELVRGGMAIQTAVHQAFTENRQMHEYENLVKAGLAKEDEL